MPKLRLVKTIGPSIVAAKIAPFRNRFWKPEHVVVRCSQKSFVVGGGPDTEYRYLLWMLDHIEHVIWLAISCEDDVTGLDFVDA